MRPIHIGFVCTSCGARRGNPEFRDPPDGFANLVNAYATELCAECTANGCRCHTWPRHRLMADGHRPDCLARPTSRNPR